MSSKKIHIALTGGGTAGHVMPHLAMLPLYKERGWSVSYIGSAGIEKTLTESLVDTYYTIAVGKLRRYLSWQNITDVFRILKGIAQSYFILKKDRPDIVFSKGGFVSVPVAFSAWLLGIPVITHESDLSPGLANKLILPFIKKLLYSFPVSGKFFSSNAEFVGIPIRQELLTGDVETGRKLCGFKDKIPVLLVMGGSLGAQRINEALKDSLPAILSDYCVVHITGRGKGIDFDHENYRSFEFLGKELADVLALADLVISRAGANSLFELLALKKPTLLVPLAVGSRGDQIENARYLKENGIAKVLEEKDLSPSTLLSSISDLAQQKSELVSAMMSSPMTGNTQSKIMQVIESVVEA